MATRIIKYGIMWIDISCPVAENMAFLALCRVVIAALGVAVLATSAKFLDAIGKK